MASGTNCQEIEAKLKEMLMLDGSANSKKLNDTSPAGKQKKKKKDKQEKARQPPVKQTSLEYSQSGGPSKSKKQQTNTSEKQKAQMDTNGKSGFSEESHRPSTSEKPKKQKKGTNASHHLGPKGSRTYSAGSDDQYRDPGAVSGGYIGSQQLHVTTEPQPQPGATLGKKKKNKNKKKKARQMEETGKAVKEVKSNDQNAKESPQWQKGKHAKVEDGEIWDIGTSKEVFQLSAAAIERASRGNFRNWKGEIAETTTEKSKEAQGERQTMINQFMYL